MNVLFIFKSENFLVPVGLCSISAAVKKCGAKPFLCELNSQDPIECIEKVKPDIIAYSSSTGEAKHYLQVNKRIKKRFSNIFTVMGGPHPTFYRNVINDGNLDAICVGEGDFAFADLIDAIANKKDVAKIANIVTRSNQNNLNVRNLIEDLDSLPFPDYSLLYDNTAMGKYPLKSIITSRGCPYECTYCFNTEWKNIHKNKGKFVRRNSVDYVIDHIKYVKSKWPLSFVKFYDDIFSYKADAWLEKFSSKYKKEINLPFFILTRADLLTEDMVKLLKMAGCQTISMSIEAGNPKIRNQMLKRNMSNEDIINAHRLCDKYDIKTFTNCIIGLPETTIEDDIESIDLAIKAKVTWSEFLVFYPFPGTELGNYTVGKGYYKPDYKKMHTSYQYGTVLNCFDKRRENVIMNMAVLGAVVTVFPWMRNLAVKRLMYLKHNFIYTFTYYITKMYILRKKIYVTKTTFLNSIKIFFKSLKQEWFRHHNKKG